MITEEMRNDLGHLESWFVGLRLAIETCDQPYDSNTPYPLVRVLDTIEGIRKSLNTLEESVKRANEQ
jgi:hypothetical protein